MAQSSCSLRIEWFVYLMARRCAFAPAPARASLARSRLRNTGTITESFGNHIKGSRFPQGGSRMAERGRPRAFDEEEVLDVTMSLQRHDGKSWSSAVASQPAETRDRFSSPSSPQVRRRS